MLCLLFYVEQVVFGFALGPWAVSSHILGHPGIVRYGSTLWSGMGPSCGVGFEANQVWVGYSQKLWATVALSFLQAGHHCRQKGVWLFGLLPCSFASLQSTFLYQRCQHIEVKALCTNQLSYSMFSSLWRCCLQQWGFAVSLWKTSYSLGNSIGWGFP